MYAFIGIVTVIIAYLIGSINFAVMFSKAFGSGDIREHGSGNAGTTNVMRINGFLPGMLTFIFDALKGLAACELGLIIFSQFVENSGNTIFGGGYAGAYFCAVACMLGHIFPLFFGFRGGKGVAISVGIFAVCCWPAIIIGLAVFAIVTLISRYVSLGSLTATLVVVIFATVLRNVPPYYDSAAYLPIQIICCLIMAGLIYYKHIGNIRRLLAGKENRIGGKKRH